MSLKIVVAKEDEYLLKSRDFVDGLKDLLLSAGIAHASMFLLESTYQG